MRTRDLKGKKFHYQGEDDNGSVFLSECTDGDEAAVVRLDRPKSGVPIKLGAELCQVRPDKTGHLEIVDSLGEGSVKYESVSDGPPMVASDAYRSGWDRTFGSNGVN